MLGNPVNPAITTLHQGKVVGFCSEMCRQKFLKNPGKYEKFLP
jgi:YHS domain-containing protein